MVIAVTGFTRTASLLASWSGVEGLGVVEYPGAILLQPSETIRANIREGVFRRIVDALTLPRPMERQTADRASGQPVFKGSLEDVNRFFREKGWTDNLPVIPPTPAKVEEYLSRTSRGPDEEIAVLPQANLRATARNIAVNAIMAGCPPQFMPLLIASVEAVADPDFQLINLGSTSCKTPWLLVNGPIVKEQSIECGIGTRSRGPNPSIGRAFHLIIHNVAGFKAGETWMGSFGYYAPFVLAEDEDGCDEAGWTPYHVERGFSRNSSTVTARTTAYWGSVGYPPETPDAEATLQVACKHQQLMIVPHISFMYGPRNMDALLLTRPTAKAVASGGYSKRDVAEYVWKNARISGRDADWWLHQCGFGSSLHKLVEAGRLPGWFDIGPDETVPLLMSPDLIDVVVCGDLNRDKLMSLWCNYNRPVTREIRP